MLTTSLFLKALVASRLIENGVNTIKFTAAVKLGLLEAAITRISANFGFLYACANVGSHNDLHV